MEDIKLFERFVNYESALASLFRELGLKENHCQLIRAFILVSKGESIFETSFSELGNVYHKKKAKTRIDSKARNAFKGLEQWQNDNQMQLIKVLVKGCQTRDKETGHLQYVKSKYEFVVLDELVKILYSDSDQVEQQIKELIAKIKTEFTPKDTAKKYHPLYRLKIARNTVVTKCQKVYELAKEAGLNPRQEFERIVNKLSNSFNSLVLADEYEQNTKNFIKEFEQQLNNVGEISRKEVITE